MPYVGSACSFCRQASQAASVRAAQADRMLKQECAPEAAAARRRGSALGRAAGRGRPPPPAAGAAERGSPEVGGPARHTAAQGWAAVAGGASAAQAVQAAAAAEGQLGMPGLRLPSVGLRSGELQPLQGAAQGRAPGWGFRAQP